jgi:hypothetical protein
LEWGEIPGWGRIRVGASPGQFSRRAADQHRQSEGALQLNLLSATWPCAQQPGKLKATPGLEATPGVGNGHANFGTGTAS